MQTLITFAFGIIAGNILTIAAISGNKYYLIVGAIFSLASLVVAERIQFRIHTKKKNEFWQQRKTDEYYRRKEERAALRRAELNNVSNVYCVERKGQYLQKTSNGKPVWTDKKVMSMVFDTREAAREAAASFSGKVSVF